MRKNQLSLKTHAQKGSTIVEVVVAVGLVLVAVFAILYSINSTKSTNRAGINKEKAKLFAEEKATALLAKIRDAEPAEGSGIAIQLNGQPVRNPQSEVSTLCETNPDFCEKISVRTKSAPDEAEAVSFLGMNDPIPADQEMSGRRVWAITKEDPARGVWRVTVAVFPAEGNVPIEDLIVRTIR